MIKIIDGYGFEQDKMNFTLYEFGQREGYVQRTKIKTGKMVDYMEPIGYYNNLTTMAEAVLKQATKKAADASEVKTIGEYIQIMQQIKNEIVTALQNVSIEKL